MAQSGSVSWNGDLYKALLKQAAALGLNEGGELVLGEAVERAPIDTANLRGSAHLTPAVPEDLVAELSFDTPYAVIQHEALDYRHTEGEAKYLERPLIERHNDVAAIVAKRIGGISG